LSHISSLISSFSIIPKLSLCQQQDKESWELDKERRSLARELRLKVRKKLAPAERFKQYEYKALDVVLAIGHETKQQYIFLDYLFGQFGRYQSGGDNKGLYKSQKVMAAESGVPLKSVSDAIKKLKQAKVIRTMKRGRLTKHETWARTTNMYVLNEYFLQQSIVSFLTPLYPAIAACLQPNLSGNYIKVKEFNYIMRKTDVRDLPTFNEYYHGQKTKKILSFVGKKTEISTQSGGPSTPRLRRINKVSGSTFGVKKRTYYPSNYLAQSAQVEYKRKENPLNGIEYDAFKVEETTVIYENIRPKVIRKPESKPKEYTPPSHMPYKPSTQRTFGNNNYTKIPDEQNIFAMMFPVPDHIKANDGC
jgi:hypothetical protein